jgi:GT2 family glycosyltransferase
MDKNYKIWHFTPWADDRDLGKAYNEYCALVPDENDWICLRDGDTMFLGIRWGQVCRWYIDNYPGTGLFSAITNRVGDPSQCVKNKMDKKPRIEYYREYAMKMERFPPKDRPREKLLKAPISGFCMLFQKKTWQRHPFEEGVGLLRIDNAFSRKVKHSKKPIVLMSRLFVWHYYRLNEGKTDKTHLL